MPIGIDMNNYDISMGTGQIRMSGGGTFTSDNSINYDWISRASAADYSWWGGCFGTPNGVGLFVTVSGSDGSNNSVMTSPDGINWTLRTTPSPGANWRAVAFGTPTSNPNGLFVAVADSGAGNRVMTSTNGISWTARDVSSNTNNWVNVAYGSGYFVAVASGGNSNRIMYSSNGINWTDVTINSTFTAHGVAFGNGMFVVTPVGSNNTVYYTTNNLSIGPPSTWVQSNNINALRWPNVTYGNGLFVAVSEGPIISPLITTGGQQLTSHVMTSPDGITWTNRYSPDIGWAGITYGGGMFVAVAIRGPGNRVMTSPDGINWTLRPSANDSLVWYGIAYGNGIFVAIAHSGGTGNRVMTLDPASGMSINKITTEETTTNLVKFGQNGATISANPSKNFAWVSRSAAENNGLQSVCYGNGQFVAVASDGTNRVMTSSDGYNWIARAVPLNTWVGVCYGELSGNNLYVAISNQNTNRVMYSSNGINWTATTSANENIGWRNICFGYDTSGNGRFVAVADGGTAGLGRVMTSPNGINWTQQNSSNNTSSWLGICYGYDSSGQGQFVSVAYDGSGNRSMYSINGGVTWVGVNTIDNNSAWNSVCYGNGTFVAVGSSGGAAGKRVMYSRHIIGAGWSQANYPVENNWRTVCFGNGLFVAVATSGTGNRVMTSPDGINWTIRASTEDNLWNSVCYGNGTFVAMSTNGTNRVMTNDYTANDNMLVLNGGISSSVGIGTNKPAATLDVIGTQIIRSTTHPQLKIINPAATYTGGKASIHFEVSTTGLNPMGKIECVDVASNNGAFNNDMVFYTGNNVALHERMRIIGTGSVGIGTTSPAAKLHVNFGGGANGIITENATASNANWETIRSSLGNRTIQGPCYLDGSINIRFYVKNDTGISRYIDVATSAYFTGQHMVVMDKPEIQQNLDDYVGLIISSNDSGCTSYYNGVKYTGIDAIRIDESLPNCKLSDIDNDKAVYGVITNQKNDDYFDTSGNPVYDNSDDGFDRNLFDRVRVNSVGEGSIWVTNINGNIENGDYITSSIIPGYGKKQNDDILHSYTVGKSIMSCDFSLTSTRCKTKTIEFNGETYIAAFIGCTYHCG